MVDLVVVVVVLVVAVRMWRISPMLVRKTSWRPSVSVRRIHPAVADLLVRRGEPSPRVAEAAALALARAGRRLSVEERDGIPVLRLRIEAEDESPLSPIEELALRRVRERMGNGMDYVPVAALGPGDGSPYTRWRGDFCKALLDEAVSQGLMYRDRYGKAWRTPVGLRAAFWWRRQVASVPRFVRHQRRLEARTGWPLRWPRDIWSSSGGAWHLVPTAPLRRPIWIPANRRTPADTTFHGAIICRFDNEFWNEDSMIIHTSHHFSVENPARRQAWTFRYGGAERPLFGRSEPQTDDRFQVGDVVEIHCDPRRRTVHRVERVDPVTPGATVQ